MSLIGTEPGKDHVSGPAIENSGGAGGAARSRCRSTRPSSWATTTTTRAGCDKAVRCAWPARTADPTASAMRSSAEAARRASSRLSRCVADLRHAPVHTWRSAVGGGAATSPTRSRRCPAASPRRTPSTPVGCCEIAAFTVARAAPSFGVLDTGIGSDGGAPAAASGTIVGHVAPGGAAGDDAATGGGCHRCGRGVDGRNHSGDRVPRCGTPRPGRVRRGRRQHKWSRIDRPGADDVRVLRDEKVPAGHDQIRIVEHPTAEVASGVGLPQRRPFRRVAVPVGGDGSQRVAPLHQHDRTSPRGWLRHVPEGHEQLPARLNGLRVVIEDDSGADLTTDVGVDDLAPTRAVPEQLLGDPPQRIVARSELVGARCLPHPGRRSRPQPPTRNVPPGAGATWRRLIGRSEHGWRPHPSCRRRFPSTP